jgi:hypothetical protein
MPHIAQTATPSTNNPAARLLADFRSYNFP